MVKASEDRKKKKKKDEVVLNRHEGRTVSVAV